MVRMLKQLHNRTALDAWHQLIDLSVACSIESRTAIAELPKPGVQQVETGMLPATDVEIDRAPVLLCAGLYSSR